MKKAIIAAGLLSLIFIAPAFGQSEKKDQLSLCKTTKHMDTISVADLVKCGKLVPADSKLIIKSFSVSIMIKAVDKPVYVDYPMSGDTFSQQSLDAIKKQGKNSKVLIEQVIAIKDSKEIKLPGLIIILK